MGESSATQHHLPIDFGKAGGPQSIRCAESRLVLYFVVRDQWQPLQEEQLPEQPASGG